ncbi:MAG TPA: type I-E CRISPR-associated protein Cse2/CasB [Fibrobacteres bacterium]|jgi:CRISPR system Cascade subunit CasB|nr:type I-E CRISPR-associated protein Cse2/CasB [Fibrobacterota bacterium]
MTQNVKSGGTLPDFAVVRKRYEKLSHGDQAQLGKHIESPEDLSLVPALYKLFPGIVPHERYRQVAFILPWCKHRDNGKSLGAQLAVADINEKRLFQVVRSETPNDLIYLRRLIQRSDFSVNWNELGKTLFFWNDNEIAKRHLVEQFFVARHAGKGE